MTSLHPAQRILSTLPASSHLITVALYNFDYYSPFTDKKTASREWMKGPSSCVIDSIPPNCLPCPDSSALHHVARLGETQDPKQATSPLSLLPLRVLLTLPPALGKPPCTSNSSLNAPRCSLYISTHIRAACSLMCLCVCICVSVHVLTSPLYCEPLKGRLCVSLLSASAPHSAWHLQVLKSYLMEKGGGRPGSQVAQHLAGAEGCPLVQERFLF